MGLQIVLSLGAIHSSPPSAAYLRRWTRSALVQIMACSLDVTRPLSELMLTYYQLDTKGNEFQWNFIWNSNIFIQENALGHIVCEMAAIGSKGRRVKLTPQITTHKVRTIQYRSMCSLLPSLVFLQQHNYHKSLDEIGLKTIKSHGKASACEACPQVCHFL